MSVGVGRILCTRVLAGRSTCCCWCPARSVHQLIRSETHAVGGGRYLQLAPARSSERRSCGRSGGRADVPLTVHQMIKLIEADGWALLRVRAAIATTSTQRSRGW